MLENISLHQGTTNGEQKEEDLFAFLNRFKL